MLRTVLCYLIAIGVFSVIAPLLGFAISGITRAFGRRGGMAPVWTGLSSAVSAAIAAMLVVWICSAIGSRPAYLMFAMPLILSVRNDFHRVDLAERPTSPVARLVGDDYDPALQVRMEYGYLVGDVLGIITPLLLLSPMPLV